MSLDNPKSKMSKSNANPDSYIGLMDPPDLIRKKISRAVTDSGREIRFDPDQKPAITNLLSIYSLCSGDPVKAIEERYAGTGYSDFKEDLATVINEHLRPFQERFQQVSTSGETERILKEGADRARALATQTLTLVKQRMGLVLL